MNNRPPLDLLPFGLLELDEQGRVRGFSPLNESYAEIHAEDVIGRDFFKEIVPVAEAEESEKKFRDFMKRQDAHERLFFTFTSAQGQIAVQIALAYLPEVNNSRLALVRLMPETEYRQLSQPED